jgi:sulfur carrier protein ThiS adenylyltransferase
MIDFEQALSGYFSPEQLARVRRTRVGLAGAGGLGSNIAVCLVRSGFRDFEIVDFDLIEMKNLNRQYYFLDEVGQPKAATLAARLNKINPRASVRARQVRLHAGNINDYFQDRDIIFEAFDGAGSKALLLESFAESGKLLVFGNGLAGLSNENEIKIKKVRQNIFMVGDGVSGVGSDKPPLAPRVVACASLMAACALEALLTT